MSLAGWPLAQIAAFFAVGTAAVTALYLLKMRRRRVVVPFAALWEQALRTSEARRLARRFRRLVSWLVQVTVLALLALALGDPRPAAWLRPPRTAILVVDTGASMAAPTHDGGPRIDAARAFVQATLRALGPADRAAVLAAGPAVRVAAALAPAGQVRARRLDLAPGPGPARLDEALGMARALARGEENPSIVVVTDGALRPADRDVLAACVAGPIPCRIHRVPGPAGNVGIAAFAARRRPFDPARVEVVARIENHDAVPHDVQLDLFAGDVPAGSVRARVPAGSEHRHVFDDLDAPGSVLRARVRGAGGDPLPGTALDDEAYATVTPVRPTRVTLVTDGTDLFLEAALLSLGETVEVELVSWRSERDEAPDIGDADVVVVDVGAQKLPPLPPDVHAVVFDPWRHDDANFPIRKGRNVRRPFLTEQDRSHPILEDIDFVDANVARGTTFRVEPGDEVLVRTVGDPIVVLRRDGRRKILAVGFDPRQSDVPLRVAFPLFVSNTLAYLSKDTPGFVATVPAAEPAVVRLSDVGLDAKGPTTATVRTAAGTTMPALPVRDGRLRLVVFEPGVFTVTLDDGAAAGASAEMAAVVPPLGSLGDALGDDPRFAGAWAEPAPEPFPVVDDPLWLLLLLVVAAVAAVEWWTYHRRVTV